MHKHKNLIWLSVILMTVGSAAQVGPMLPTSGSGSWFWIDNPSGYLRFSSGGAPGNNPVAITNDGYLGVGTVTPNVRFHLADPAKVYNSVNNEYDSNFDIQGTYSSKAVGQGPSLGFTAPANTDGSNPWEMARILGSPDNASTYDAHGRMYLQTRTMSGGNWTWNNNLVLTSAGNVGVGTTTPGAILEVNGNVKLSTGSGASITFPDSTVQATAWNGTTLGGDYAESVDVLGGRAEYEPGDVIVIDADVSGKFSKSDKPYSRFVAGVFSTKPGLVGRRTTADRPDKQEEIPMAMMGIVPTKVSTENGAIERGDLLVSASTPGYAMKGTDKDRLTGAVIGKALAPLDVGIGVIEVLVSLQ